MNKGLEKEQIRTNLTELPPWPQHLIGTHIIGGFNGRNVFLMPSESWRAVNNGWNLQSCWKARGVTLKGWYKNHVGLTGADGPAVWLSTKRSKQGTATKRAVEIQFRPKATVCLSAGMLGGPNVPLRQTRIPNTNITPRTRHSVAKTSWKAAFRPRRWLLFDFYIYKTNPMEYKLVLKQMAILQENQRIPKVTTD